MRPDFCHFSPLLSQPPGLHSFIHAANMPFTGSLKRIHFLTYKWRATELPIKNTIVTSRNRPNLIYLIYDHVCFSFLLFDQDVHSRWETYREIFHGINPLEHSYLGSLLRCSFHLFERCFAWWERIKGKLTCLEHMADDHLLALMFILMLISMLILLLILILIFILISISISISILILILS